MANQTNAIIVASELDIAQVRTQARLSARVQGFNIFDQARIATAASQLTHFFLRSAGCDHVLVHGIERDGRKGVEFLFTCRGQDSPMSYQQLPSNLSILAEMEPGMQGVHHFIDEFEVEAHPNITVTVLCRKWQG